MKRIAAFCIITFSITYALEFGVIYPMAGKESLGLLSATSLQLAVSMVMFVPSLGVVLTRLATREGFGDLYVKPKGIKRNIRFFLLAWFGPSVLVAIGATVYYLAFPGDFDMAMSYAVAAIDGQLATAGADPMAHEAARLMLLGQIPLGVALAPLFNVVTCFGEEWGWRGYLLPKLSQRLSFVPTVLVNGVIWGLWHAPLTALGHNYGLGYPGFPLAGIAAMCLFCIVFGTFLGYLTLKTGSCLPAALSHGAMNGVAGAAVLFSATGGNPFVGPLPVGIVGGSAFVVAALLICLKMKSAPLLPAAGPVEESG